MRIFHCNYVTTFKPESAYFLEDCIILDSGDHAKQIILLSFENFWGDFWNFAKENGITVLTTKKIKIMSYNVTVEIYAKSQSKYSEFILRFGDILNEHITLG